MTSDSRQIVQRLWSYCSILRDDGLSYPDYVEQLTYLLFLKMAHEQATTEARRNQLVPPEFGWQNLVTKSGADLHRHYTATLAALGKGDGMLATIFRGAKNKIRDPAKLRLLVVDLIDQRNWSALDADVKGDAYEGLLEKNSQDTKSGAGQYFTPRPLVRAIVECVRPRVDETIFDPACGTGGFLLGAHEFISRTTPRMTASQLRFLNQRALRGAELVGEVTRLGAMNLMLHGIGPVGEAGEPPIATIDSLREKPNRRYDVVLTNPPFGKKSSVTVVADPGRARKARESLTIARPDFWASTSNKELAFLQHVAAALDDGGRAAIVVPDGVLSVGGAGETVRRRLLEEFDVHTLLRLPTGIFYATGVNANVLFFDRPRTRRQRPSARRLWVYDFRTSMRFTLVSNRLQRIDLNDFVECYRPSDRLARVSTWTKNVPSGRWRSFDHSELQSRDKCSWDLLWLDDVEQNPHRGAAALEELTDQIFRDLETAIAQLSELTGRATR